MTRLYKTPVLNVFLKRQPPQRERTVHEVLSDLQAAYTVFVPKPDDFFNLFEIIFLHPVRPLSPRNTNTNLYDIFKMLHDLGDEQTNSCNNNLVDAFMKQFEKVSHREQDSNSPREPAKSTVSEEALRGAGFSVSTPGPNLGSRAAKASSIYRQLSLSWLSSDFYTGRKQLQKLIWDHAEEVFLLILLGLEDRHFMTANGNKSLMGIVTRRLISNVGVSRVDENGAAVFVEVDSGAAPVGGGAKLAAKKKKVYREAYDNLYGVSGLHFIAFRVECLDPHRWRFYRGIDVCDSELDESDAFNQAYLWLRGNETAGSDYKTVTDTDSIRPGSNAEDASVQRQMMQEDPEFVIVTNKHETTRFVDLDIRPILSEFANKQCNLAAYYRKTYRNNYENAARIVSLLRSALRKCRFESTVRALYDLSGCYLHGRGARNDIGMARLLRHCAAGMRRNYDTRVVWLRRLRLEISYQPDCSPERSIGAMALLARWRPVVSQEEMREYLEQFAGGELEIVQFNRMKRRKHVQTQRVKRRKYSLGLSLPFPLGSVKHTEDSSGTMRQAEMSVQPFVKVDSSARRGPNSPLGREAIPWEVPVMGYHDGKVAIPELGVPTIWLPASLHHTGESSSIMPQAEMPVQLGAKAESSAQRGPNSPIEREAIARRMATIDYHDDNYGAKHWKQWQAIALHLLNQYEFSEDTVRETSKAYVRLCVLKDELRDANPNGPRVTLNHWKEVFRILNLPVTGEWDRRGHGGLRGPYVYGCVKKSGVQAFER